MASQLDFHAVHMNYKHISSLYELAVGIDSMGCTLMYLLKYKHSLKY